MLTSVFKQIKGDRVPYIYNTPCRMGNNERDSLPSVLLHQSRTPEYASVLRQRCPSPQEFLRKIPFASENIRRVDLLSADELRTALSERGSYPVVFRHAVADWQALHKWSFAFLASVAGHHIVRVNDRAPARHADALPGGGGRQNSHHLRLSDYLSYVEQLPRSLETIDPIHPPGTPFYLNGWRAFTEVPALVSDCPPPQFCAAVDETLELLQAIDNQLFKGSKPHDGSDWCAQVNLNLNKVFLGPPGTVTRLHFDAGEAHGWLAQVSGRKLFLLFHPADTPHLHLLTTEVETAQSPIDPLQPDLEKYPEYRKASPIACILSPGEAILIPKGWWHYAVALDRSITVQRNFYEGASNAGGLVKMVLKTAGGLKRTSPSSPR